MSDSCVNKADQSQAEDGRSDVSSELSTVPELQHSCTEEKEHLQVYLRIRPLTSAESSSGESQDCVTVETPDTVLLKPPGSSLLARLSSERSLPQTGQRFQFSKVYGPETTQSELFEGTVRDLVRDVLEGGNSLVFTYGVTNSGKTFTFLGPDADAGIVPRSLRVIFGSIHDHVLQCSSVKPSRCREFVTLSREQQAEEARFKKNLLRQNEKLNISLLNTTTQPYVEDSAPGAAADGKISLEIRPNTKFSVWVSFCEIYNENIHDLLELAPIGAARRAALRLAQDAKGNAYVKDLRWVEVSSAEEANRVVQLGRRNQSFSSTRLNQLSSRSHSVFSVRILSVEDGDPPRVHSISELCLCDLAGSERCTRTQNQGERLKEAGNINASLLILGKCIKALRHNQQAKLLQHIPFRESKLTHYLQSFLCGRGRTCMIVNISRCASMYDETLNVLKFSAVAQKVVVLISRPPLVFPSCSESSTLIGSAGRKTESSWESSLEDVQEDEDKEEASLMEDADGESDEIITSKRLYQGRMALMQQLQLQLKKERAENLLLEARVREEISREFSQLFSDMQKDYDERLAREKEILEERAERRLEIFKNLTERMSEGRAADGFVSPRTSEPSGRCRLCLGGGQSDPQMAVGEKAAEDPQSVDLKAGETEEDDDRARLLLELQDKSQRLAELEQRLEDLQKTEPSPRSRSASDEDESSPGQRLQEALSALSKDKTKREEMLAALDFQTQGKEEALASLQTERSARKEVAAALEEQRLKREELVASLENERRANQEARNLLDEEKRIREEEERKDKELLQQQVRELTDKLQAQSVQPTPSSSDITELSKSLAEERRSSETKQKRIEELQRELEALTQQLLLSDQQKEQLRQAEQQAEELRKRLQEQEKVRETSDQEAALLRGKIRAEQEVTRQLEELQLKLREQQEAAEKLLQEAQLNGAALSSSNEDLRRTNSHLQTEITALNEKLSSLEETRASSSEAQQKLTQLEKEAAQREAQLQEAERRLTCLQEAKERHEEEERQAAQDIRTKEVERRRELLAVAHQAIAEKDAELEKKADEIRRLKESAQQEADRVEKLSVELQRTRDASSDLQEKLADYRKQFQQVQKEISVMRDEENALKQKLADADKAKKSLQSDVAGRDRTIQQLRAEQPDSKSAQTLQLYQKACKELEAKQRVMDDMRLALTEQEETQQQLDQVLEEKMSLAQQLSEEVDRLKAKLLQQNHKASLHGAAGPSEDLELAKDEASKAQESLKILADKHQAERRKWQEEKMSLIGQAKEAEDKRNQEMRKFAEDRERHGRQQALLETKLEEKEKAMEGWRQERDVLVGALEVQLQKLLSSQAEKDKVIKELQERSSERPPEVNDGGDPPGGAALRVALAEREAEILQLKQALHAAGAKQETATTTPTQQDLIPAEKPKCETKTAEPERRETRASVSSRGSSGVPSLLESSTENGRSSRFPRPEVEISFSPLQPNRVALRRQGEEDAVTVKITRSARKRKSVEMEKQEEVETENLRNTRSKLTPKLTPQREESSSPAGRHDSRSRKDGTLQKIGDFLQSSPTMLGSKAKKMMSLVSGRRDAVSSSSLGLRSTRGRKKLYRPDISSPMEMSPHPIINHENDDSESDHQIIRRRLRSRVAKC